MGRTLEKRALRTLEEGQIELFYRPRVEEQNEESLEDVQRLLIVLCPANRARFRLLAIGRKQLHERFWGFVDLVLDDARDLDAALEAHVYVTKGGVRHMPAARMIARGQYHIEEHDGYSHLQYFLDHIEAGDDIVRELGVEREATFIVSVANPDPSAWGLSETPDVQFDLFDEPEVHVALPTPFPATLQKHFDGRRYTQLDSPRWLDHPGAELIFLEA
ncbi:MAG: hypothetical protein ACXVJO_14925 [Thermoanaerobaculia bacterium]